MRALEQIVIRLERIEHILTKAPPTGPNPVALVNEREAAIDFIERAVEFGFINLPLLSEHEPFLANLRGEPRFGRLMERVRRAWEAFEP